MQIIFFIKALHDASGGAERVLCMVASGLCRRGHGVTIVTCDGPDRCQPFYDIDQDVRILPLDFGRARQKTTSIDFIRRIFAYRRVIKNMNPDVVVGYMHSAMIPLAFAAVGLRVPVLGSEHIVPEHFKTRKLEMWLYYLALPFIRQITVLSGKIRDQFPHFIRHKMIPVPNPVSPAPILANVLGCAGKRKIILNVGRLDPQKDQATLIAAFAQIADEFLDWDLHIYGDGNLKKALRYQIDKLNMAGRIYLQGVTRDIGHVYQTAQVFALSSRYESFGLATAEAMAHGLPVIGFADCPGTNELIEHHQNGVLVAGENRAQALSDGLRRLLRDSSWREDLGRCGVRSLSPYHPEAIVEKWESLLFKIAN